ncbi:choice-of-anchor D domain-containing protein [candidate division KSB1 bacterium]|nr:choice-of-anchor D domain-containing protein [candidate division KSB1 bacterium]
MKATTVKFKLITIALLGYLLVFSPDVLAQYNIWQAIGPYCGDVQALACDPLHPDTLYAGTYGGIFKSTDGGASWREINHGLADPWIQAIAVDPQNPQRIYLGTSHDGVYKSSSGGLMWTSSNIEIYQFDIHSLVIDPSSPNILYAGTFGKGVYISHDYGETWEARNEGITNLYIRCLAIHSQRPEVIFAGTSFSGIFISYDQGSNWTHLVCAELNPPNVFALALDPVDPDILYAGVCGAGVYKINLTDSTCVAINSGLADKFIRCLATDPRAPNTLYAGTFHSGIFKKEHESADWRSINVQMTAEEIRALLVHPQKSSIMYAGTFEGGIYKSYNGGELWGDVNFGLAIASVYSLALLPDTPGALIAGCSKGLLKRGGQHTNWRSWLSNKTISAVAVNPKYPTHIMIGAGKEGIIHTKNGGESWFYLNQGLPVWRKLSDYTNTIAFDPIYPSTIFAGTETSIFRLQDADTVWTDVGYTGIENIQSIAIRPDQSEILFIGTREGLFKSDDRGGTWVRVETGLPTRPNVRSLVIDPENSNIIYASVWAKSIYKSTTGGLNWTRKTNGLPTNYITTLLVDADQSQMLYAGTYGFGVYQTLNGANYWTPLNPELSDQFVNVLAKDENRIYAGTNGGGVFEIELQPEILLSETGHSFGDVRVDSTGLWSVSISNTGLKDLIVSEIKISHTAFECSDEQLTIAPAASRTVFVSFNPYQRGSLAGTLKLTSNDPNITTVTLSLSGKGVAPVISSGSLESLNYGDVIVGQGSDKSLLIYNLGDAPLAVDSLKINNNRFAIVTESHFSISPLQSRSITIRFAPDSVKLESGILAVYSDDPARQSAPLLITLEGKGIPAPFSWLAIQPDSIDFGGVFLADTKDSTFAIDNQGTAVLKVYEILSDDENFRIIGPPSLTIDPSESKSFWLRFRPFAAGSLRAKISLVNNSKNDSSKCVVAKGFGLTASLRVTTTAVNFGIIRMNSKKDTIITFHNDGNASLQVRHILTSNSTFSIESETAFELLPQTQKALSIRFEPPLPQSETGQIVVTYEANQQDTLKIDVMGRVSFSTGALCDTIQGGSAQTAFRMISVPAIMDEQNPEQVFSSILGTYNRKQWRMFRWQEGRRRELFSETLSPLLPGTAYWLISSSPRPLNYGAGISTPVDRQTEIALAPGWNQIACPYPFPVSWQNVLESTNEPELLDTLYYYDGSYSMSEVLIPYEGYWVFNEAPAESITIRIPPNAFHVLSKYQSNQPAGADWWLQIRARCLAAADNINFLGVRGNASHAPDRYDFREPPPVGEYISAYFIHDTTATEPQKFTTDFRPASENGHIWTLMVESNISSEKARIEIENIEMLPQNYQIFLVDESAGSAHNVRSDATYQFLTGKQQTQKKFRLIAGNREFMEQRVPELSSVPRKFELAQNYPNPFSESGANARPLTVLSYAIPCECNVTLTIYDLIGREIKQLISKRQAAGTYRVFWDATDRDSRRVPSGVYFYKLVAGSEMQVKKLIFAK